MLPAVPSARTRLCQQRADQPSRPQPEGRCVARRSWHPRPRLRGGVRPLGPIADRPIIAVQLPTPVVARTTGELLDFYVAARSTTFSTGLKAEREPSAPSRGDQHQLRLHRRPARRHGGGRNFVEVATANAPSPTRIVLPAGNAQLSRCHATIDLVTHENVEFDWIVQPNDRTHSVVHVWLPGPAATG